MATAKKGAPIGNEFWKLRATHGRKLAFKDANILWAAACEYFQNVTDNPLHEQDWVGKNAKEVDKHKMRAMSIKGLCVFLGVSSTYFFDFEERIKTKKDKRSKDFSNVITRIRDIIWSQKFEGSAAGLLNPNIIARELGLVDKIEAKNDNTNRQEGPVEVLVKNSGVPLASDESEIDTAR